jgi:hypothetical protein
MKMWDKFKKSYEDNLAVSALLLAIFIVLVIVLLFGIGLARKSGEKFIPVSYSAGADQRFQQINTDPTLGKQFGPYNDEIEARKALLGKTEGLTASNDPPVIYNYTTGGGYDIHSPMASNPGRSQVEAGLRNTGDSAVNGEGTPQDSDVEDLVAELYA